MGLLILILIIAVWTLHSKADRIAAAAGVATTPRTRPFFRVAFWVLVVPVVLLVLMAGAGH